MLYSRENIKLFPIPESVKTPWFESLGELPRTLEYSNGTMYDKLAEVARKFPNNVAFDFMGRGTTYKNFWRRLMHVHDPFEP